MGNIRVSKLKVRAWAKEHFKKLKTQRSATTKHKTYEVQNRRQSKNKSG